jgi:hypothetical protein
LDQSKGENTLNLEDNFDKFRKKAEMAIQEQNVSAEK